jgi:hypothetical protein
MKNTPKREIRLNSAKNWIKTYTGNNLVKGYSKKYSVDKLCAVKELRMIGVDISEEYEKQLINSMEALRQQRLSFKKKLISRIRKSSFPKNLQNLILIQIRISSI